MKPTTYTIVKASLDGDDTITASDREAILKVCREPCGVQNQPQPTASANSGITRTNQRLARGSELRQDVDQFAGTSHSGTVSVDWSAMPTATSSDDSMKTVVLDSDWLETEQVAAYLHLTPKTVREGAARGSLPGHKYPFGSSRGRWRFKASELDDWMTRVPRKTRLKGASVW